MTPDEYYALATKRNLGIVSPEEQQQLRRTRIAIIGMGGGGGIYLTTFARMGIGHFNIADFDAFSVVNVNRQAGAMQSTIGKPKVEVMAGIARDIHPGVDVTCFDHGIGEHNVEAFIANADIVIDAVDVFAQPARQLVYRTARKFGKPVLFSAPLGLSATLGVFMPDGMTFEEYFDIREGMDAFQHMVAFLVGLGPAGTHLNYMDLSYVEPAEQAGPSSAAAISLMAGVVGAEALAILLKRRPAFAIPCYAQFDPYMGVYKTGKLRWGNRGPLQRLKRRLVEKKFGAIRHKFNDAGFEPLPTKS